MAITIEVYQSGHWALCPALETTISCQHHWEPHFRMTSPPYLHDGIATIFCKQSYVSWISMPNCQIQALCSGLEITISWQHHWVPYDLLVSPPYLHAYVATTLC